ncbi:acyl-CoA dehydrogenase family protein [Streptomyces sp. NPDC058398]|uniref:acyl-CoA dehydrogenase family protein n=1 Tax=Streptomyces sp. NPDC058398 TaxID=3346479 RepID=UPI00365DE943
MTPTTAEAVRHATSVAARWAGEVDRGARFPAEAVAALRENGLLNAAAPGHMGGLGLSTRELTDVAAHLARGCGATAMVWAMHQVQLACLTRHHPDSALLHRALAEQWLIASVTSEAGVGGDLRTSRAAVGRTDTGARVLEKHATTVSYGAYAQGFLVTARRDADAAPGDQVAVLVDREQVRLEQTGTWDTLGMRGTCSPSFDLHMVFDGDQALPVPFGDIAARTMVPLSHLLWSGVWTGLAAEAVHRTARITRDRHRGGAADANIPLAEAYARLAGIRAQLTAAVTAAEPVLDHDKEPVLALTVELNALKIAVSETAVDIVRTALNGSGMAGFSEQGPHSVARILRDVSSAPLMIGNGRLLTANAQMLLLTRGEG